MASPNHTAQSCPSVRTGASPSTPPTDDTLPKRSSVQERRLYRSSQRVGIKLAMQAIEEVLKSRSTLTSDSIGEQRGRVPLSLMQNNGLNAALYFLRQYVDTLAPLRGG